MGFPAAWLFVTRIYPVYLADELIRKKKKKKLILAFYAPLWLGLNGGSVGNFLSMVSMILVRWDVAAILGNRYGIQGQTYVALLLGSQIPAGFHYRNLILGI